MSTDMTSPTQSLSFNVELHANESSNITMQSMRDNFARWWKPAPKVCGTGTELATVITVGSSISIEKEAVFEASSFQSTNTSHVRTVEFPPREYKHFLSSVEVKDTREAVRIVEFCSPVEVEVSSPEVEDTSPEDVEVSPEVVEVTSPEVEGNSPEDVEVSPVVVEVTSPEEVEVTSPEEVEVTSPEVVEVTSLVEGISNNNYKEDVLNTGLSRCPSLAESCTSNYDIGGYGYYPHKGLLTVPSHGELNEADFSYLTVYVGYSDYAVDTRKLNSTKDYCWNYLYLRAHAKSKHSVKSNLKSQFGKLKIKVMGVFPKRS